MTTSKISGTLPIEAVLDDLKATLARRPSAVLVAPPGAGKSTVVPLALLGEPWLAGRHLLLLAPRRLAARAAARRMATMMGEKVGQTVGYRIRMERRVGRSTRIEVVTEGVLTRMLQRDPALTGVGLVIFDEFHERSLDADLGLALCQEIQGVLNDELRLLVMSATLDPATVTKVLSDAPLIRCEGRVFPVKTRYVERPASRPVTQTVADVIRRSVLAGEGNILVFLPGAREIRRVSRHLEEMNFPPEWMIVPLYGNLPRDLQDSAIAAPPAGRYKIVLATAIAETSLTIEGVGVVVDGGLQRTPRFDPASGMSRLVTLPVSRASADQRRGRAGRLGPGVCYRLWREAAHPTLVARNRPEILDADLTGLALELATWGLPAPDALTWLDPPPAAAFSAARRLLTDLGALDPDGNITPHGREMAELPLHPRLAHMVLSAPKNDQGTACDVAAIVSERDPLVFTGRERDADIQIRLDALQSYRHNRPWRLSGCRVTPSAVARIAKASKSLVRHLGLRPDDRCDGAPGHLLAWAYPDRIGRRRAIATGRYLLTSGRGVTLSIHEPLAACDWLVAAHTDGRRQDARIFLAAAIDALWLKERFADRMTWRCSISWDGRRHAVSAVRERMLGVLMVATEPLSDPDPGLVVDAMVAGIRRHGMGILPWTRALRVWQSRVAFLGRMQADGQPWPDVSDAALTDDLETWLGPWLAGLRRIKDLTPATLARALRSRLDWRQQRLLETLAPTHLVVPSGSRLPLDYAASIPVLAVRIQELFGCTDTPAIVQGRVPVMLHLLSPAGRPTQITQDLGGFWKNGYPQVKKELMGRYPKHHWPDDPVRAAATRRTKPKKRNRS